jgi:signal transduction histidine kinase
VSDFGIGIPEDEKKEIFKKFYRVGNEETRTTKGTGLGLYIIKELVEIQKGSIKLYDNSPRGVVFEVVL